MTTVPPALFVHLRNHSAYSLAEGMLKIQTLVKSASDFGQPAVAITDSFNTFAALEFSEKAAAEGIQPIIGVQVILSDSDDTESSAGGEQAGGEVVLLVQNETGWKNLSRLISDALLEGSNAPKISLDALQGFSEGLILLTGGARVGFVGGAVAAGQDDLAKTRIKSLMALFDDRLYIEIQRHNTREEAMAEPVLLDLAYSLDVPLVATNDCYFLKEEDAFAHEVLLCISKSTTLADDSRRRETAAHYLKSSEDMQSLFADLPEAISNTVVIAQRCAYRVPMRDPILPAFAVPESMTEADFLRQQAKQGLDLRMKSKALVGVSDNEEEKKRYIDRLDEELATIIKMGFPGYFLIVADFINWARDKGIPVGPGRGSGAGSLVAYVLGITDLDPIRWGLLFERFLNPERVSMPDFDIDFCQDRRDEVITYVQQKYGADRVAQIITFGSLQARAAVRDVGRVLGMPYGHVDRIAKLIPNNPANPMTLPQVVETEEEIRAEAQSDDQVAELIRISCALEGLYRHASTHAAGLVIGDRPLPELVPLYRDPRSEMPVTQFNMKWVEMAGLVKFDFLGLKTLTVLEKALELLKARGVKISLDDIPLSDDATFAMLSKGDTIGVFQMESSGMREVLRGLKPDRFEDIIAVVALYRPGPMDNIPEYISRKHGKSEVKYMHPELAPILEETYGIMIYQEQVQRAAQRLAGYTLGGADILRRAMGKKIKSEMDAQRETFIKGSADKDIDENLASRIFDQIAAFAGYGFNKSHAAAYALIAWQTAWLKVHYPEDFIAASMSLDYADTDRLSVFRHDCQQHEIKILSPDVNTSAAIFAVEPDADKLAIRYALGAIRNVGFEVMRQLVEERNRHGVFTSLDDFATRMGSIIPRRALEYVVKAGALDTIEPNRGRLLGGIEHIVAHGTAIRNEQESSQDNLFNKDGDNGLILAIPDADDVHSRVKLEHEIEALGLYISAHPLDDYADQLKTLDVVPSVGIEETVTARGNGVRLNLAGLVSAVQNRQSKKGNRFAFVQFTDALGSFEVTVFSEALLASRDLLASNKPLLIKADAKMESGGVRLLASEIKPLDGVISKHNTGRDCRVEVTVNDAEAIRGVARELSRDGSGATQFRIAIPTESGDVIIDIPGKFRLGAESRQVLKHLPGVAEMRDIH